MEIEQGNVSDMPHKDPSNYSAFVYGWVVALACWGGIVNYIQKVKSGATRKFNLTELVGELITSGFVGLLVFWICEYYNVPPLAAAPLIGISGHFSSKTILLFEKLLEKRFGE